jgi:hypothetical protein
MARGIGDDFKVHPWGNWRIGWVYPVIYIPIHCLYGFRVEQRDLQHKYVGKSLAITPLPTPTGQESPGKAHQLAKSPLESCVPPTGEAHPVVRPSTNWRSLPWNRACHQLAKPTLSFVPSTNWRSLPGIVRATHQLAEPPLQICPFHQLANDSPLIPDAASLFLASCLCPQLASPLCPRPCPCPCPLPMPTPTPTTTLYHCSTSALSSYTHRGRLGGNIADNGSGCHK